MKSVVKETLKYLIYLLSCLFTNNRINSIKSKKNYLYSLWISNFLGSLGNGSRIIYPCMLWGGGSKHIYVGEGSTIQGNCILGCWVKYGNQTFSPSIEIGNNCNIGGYTHITAINKITIGNGLLTGRYVYIGDNSHGGLSWEESDVLPIRRELQSKGVVVIGDNVWIGDKATILAGVHIGNNVIVAANSVVTHDIPSNCIAAGIPAKVIKHLAPINK